VNWFKRLFHTHRWQRITATAIVLDETGATVGLLSENQCCCGKRKDSLYVIGTGQVVEAPAGSLEPVLRGLNR
jgi:hypothetical protein